MFYGFFYHKKKKKTNRFGLFLPNRYLSLPFQPRCSQIAPTRHVLSPPQTLNYVLFLDIQCLTEFCPTRFMNLENFPQGDARLRPCVFVI